VAGFVAAGWEIVITHGNGPQVGINLLRNELAAQAVPASPLDVLGAETQGAIGYLIQQTFADEFLRRGIAKSVVTVVTQVVVDKGDPALGRPAKFVGPGYPAAEAERFAQERGWVMREDAGAWRRVVPSPRPRGIVELRAIRALIRRGFVVVAAGGGGIPVVREPDGSLRGVEAVVDKDLVASLLARDLGAVRLVISTAVEKVALDFRTPQQRDLDIVTVEEARRYLDAGHFPDGSMGPKIQAAVEFLEGGGHDVIITSPEALGRAMDGHAGTRIIAPGDPARRAQLEQGTNA
jgi:carbamate kinase